MQTVRGSTTTRIVAEVVVLAFMGLVAFAASKTDLAVILFPELVALSHDVINRPQGKWASQPLRLIVTPTVTAALGLLTYDLVQGTVLAVMVTVLCSITILRRFEVHMPPALAVGLLPFVIKMPNYKFPISVFLGTIALVLYWFGYRPILQMLKNT
jgi:CBS-domain-containing membrane protein